MTGYPSAADLIDSVRGLLADIESSLAGREAFHAKVAGNVLAIVERELRLRPDESEAAALSRILGKPAPLPDLRAALCAAIRDGKASTDTPGLVESLIEATLARLAVDNPKFSTFRRLTEASS